MPQSKCNKENKKVKTKKSYMVQPTIQPSCENKHRSKVPKDGNKTFSKRPSTPQNL